MADPYALLDLPPDADAAALKAAYHRQLRRFPAHSHPEEFQRIRAAYDSLRAAGANRDDPLQPGPLRAELDGEVLAALEARLRRTCRIDLATLLRLTL